MGIGDDSPQKGYAFYVHQNPDDLHIYIGISNNVKRRWKNKAEAYRGCWKIYNAFKKYGWDHFNHIVLFDGLTKEEACAKEKDWIKAAKLAGICYNITDGGEGTCGVTRSEEHKQILRERRLGIKVPRESVEKTAETLRLTSPRRKKIYAFDINTKQLVKEYHSISAAAREVGVGAQTITRAAKGGRPSAGGYIWSYTPTINRNNPRYDAIGINKPRKVYCYDLYGNFIRTYESSAEAVEDVGGLARAINACCTKDIVSYKHYIWRYELCKIEPEILKKVRFKKHEAYQG